MDDRPPRASVTCCRETTPNCCRAYFSKSPIPMCHPQGVSHEGPTSSERPQPWGTWFFCDLARALAPNRPLGAGSSCSTCTWLRRKSQAYRGLYARSASRPNAPNWSRKRPRPKPRGLHDASKVEDPEPPRTPGLLPLDLSTKVTSRSCTPVAPVDRTHRIGPVSALAPSPEACTTRARPRIPKPHAPQGCSNARAFAPKDLRRPARNQLLPLSFRAPRVLHQQLVRLGPPSDHPGRLA